MKRLAGFFTLFFIFPLFGASEWTFRMESEGIRSFTRPLPGWQVHQARGVGIIDADFETVTAARLDFSRFFKYNKNMASFVILKDDGPHRKVVYAVVDVPWPASDRDVVFQVEVTAGSDTMVFTSRSIDGYPGAPLTPKGMVRMERMEEVHTFTRQGNRTLMVTESVADPGGTLPKPVINMMLGSAPITTIKTVRELVRGEGKGK